MRNLLLVLLLSIPALALPTPQQVVSKIYHAHLKTQDMRKTVAELPRSFSPEFLDILQRALARPGVDFDIFTHGQGKMSDFFVDDTVTQSKDAQVHVKVWMGERIGQQSGLAQDVTLYLTNNDDGRGFQVYDIQFPGKPRFKVRDFLTPIAEGR